MCAESPPVRSWLHPAGRWVRVLGSWSLGACSPVFSLLLDPTRIMRRLPRREIHTSSGRGGPVCGKGDRWLGLGARASELLLAGVGGRMVLGLRPDHWLNPPASPKCSSNGSGSVFSVQWCEIWGLSLRKRFSDGRARCLHGLAHEPARACTSLHGLASCRLHQRPRPDEARSNNMSIYYSFRLAGYPHQR